MEIRKFLQSSLQSLGRSQLNYIQAYGASFYILISSIFIIPQSQRSYNLLLKEIYKLGFLSLPIIVVSAAFVGLVLSLQGYTILSNFSAESAVGQLVALSLIRELGPVLSALLFAGRSGSSLTAELALMQTTEQVSSMEMMGVDPLRHLVAPRFWAGVISLPILTVVFNIVGIWAGGFLAIEFLGIYDGSYWGNMREAVDFGADILNGSLKSVVFAFVVTWLAIYQGYSAKPTAEGIGSATTKVVVFASLAILGLDFLLTALLFSGV